MNYSILKDNIYLNNFVDWLPELEPTEKFYCCLFARKKYCKDIPWIKSDKGQLKRFLSNKERLKEKIQQLECPIGSYKLDGESVPQEALAIYISPNPRCLRKATFGGIRKLLRLIENNNIGYNPHQEILSEIQRSASPNKKFIIFDLDWKDKEKLNKCIDIVDGFCDVVETRGGYHLFVLRDLVDKISNKKWYMTLKKEMDIDVTGDTMTPIVGCYQGGFIPNFIYKYEK